MDQQEKIYVAGHRGMVGSAIVRKLQQQGQAHIVARNHGDLDLLNQQAVNDFFALEKPSQVYLRQQGSAAFMPTTPTLRTSSTTTCCCS